jgi:heptosyltransferase-2
VTLPRPGWRRPGAALLDQGFEVAILLPNSWHAALTAMLARIPERWGYRADWRGGLLTRAVDRPAGVHQAAYYQYLVRALGFPGGPAEGPAGPAAPRLALPDDARESGIALLKSAGWNGTAPLVGLAPGAAYGGAKRWPPESFASLARALAEDGIRTVMVGSGGDRATAACVAAAECGILDLVGRTDLAALAGVLAACRAVVSNDSGPMHLAAAVGTPVTAIFGSTDEHATGPLGPGHTVVAHDTWCRPCLLRECPLDHQCMRGVEVAQVLAATRRGL